jgi:hypothetical protein
MERTWSPQPARAIGAVASIPKDASAIHKNRPAWGARRTDMTGLGVGGTFDGATTPRSGANVYSIVDRGRGQPLYLTVGDQRR